MGKIVKVSGPLVVATGMEEANMADVVRVGEQRLIGEILNMTGDAASIQVYEETSGLGPGAEVVTTGAPLSVELGPGLIENIYDGIQRPLEVIREVSGSNSLPRGVEVPALDREKKWAFTPAVQPGTRVVGGDVLGTVQETESILHKIMLPPRMKGTIVSIQGGPFTVTETVAVLEQEDGSRVELPMMQKWPVRVGRPYKHKYPPVVPLQSGQRIVDTFFPVAKGGTPPSPAPFGSGKTVMQHALAKWSDVDLVVYIGCGERGNRDDRRAPGVPPSWWTPYRSVADEADTCSSPTPLICRWPPVRRPSTPASPSQSTSGTWVTPWPSLPTPPPAGPRPCARCPAVWRRCPARRAIPPTSAPAWPSSMSGPAPWPAWAPTRHRRGSLSRRGRGCPLPGGDLSEPGLSRPTMAHW